MSATKATNFFESFSGIVKTIWSGVQTIINVVSIIKMVAEDQKYAVGEYVEKGSEIVKGALDTASNVISTVKTFYDIFAGGVPIRLAKAVPGLDIAVSVVNGIMKGYYLALSTHRWFEMRKVQRQIKTTWKDDPRYQKVVGGKKEFDQATFEELRRFYTGQETIIATAQKLSAEKEEQIKKLEEQKAKIIGNDAKSIQRRQDLDTRIAHARQQKAQYDNNILTAQNAIAAKENATIGRQDTSFYQQQESIIAANRQRIQDLDTQIARLEELKARMSGSTYKDRLAWPKIQLEISRLKRQQHECRQKITNAEKTIREKEQVERVGQKAHLSRTELAEFELAGELKTVNRERIVRQAVHITTEVLKVAGTLASMASATGYGLVTSVGLKASASGIELSMSFFEAIRQWGRDTAAKNWAKGTHGISNLIFDESKATAARLQTYKRRAFTILTMAAKLEPPVADPATERSLYQKQKDNFDRGAARVEQYISATGCPPEKLYRFNGQPLKQLEILAQEMTKREL